MSESESQSNWSSTRGEDEPGNHVDLRTDIPHPARMYDYYLGGKDHFPADRAAAEAAIAAYPPLRELARANRAFLGRAVRYAHARGLDQFLDVGTGIPTAGSTGEVLSELGSPASVVYVDNDPIVLTHSRALLTGRPGARTTVVQADLREPKAILERAEAQGALDLSRPVALLLVSMLHFVPEEDGVHEAVRTLRDALAPGSLLIISHGSPDFASEAAAEGGKEAYRKASSPLVLRPRAEIARFFGEFTLVDPGLVQLPLWQAESEPAPGWETLSAYAGVAEKTV